MRKYGILIFMAVALTFLVGIMITGCAKPKAVPITATATAAIVQCVPNAPCTISPASTAKVTAGQQIAVMTCPSGFTKLNFYPNEVNPDGSFRQKQPLHGNSDGATVSIKFPTGTLICSKLK